MKKSFTLIEILVVTTIISLLVSVAAVTYSQVGKQSRDSKRKADVEQIRAALEMYRSQYDVYPVTTFKCNNFYGLTDYIKTMPEDPKSDYAYRCLFSTSDYTVGALLETSSTGDCGNCGSSIPCNYCVGPYGQIIPP